MEYLTTAQIAEKWNISDRRVRTLCKEGRITGVVEKNGGYLIPFDAPKPADKRFRKPVYTINTDDVTWTREVPFADSSYNTILYLKWEDDVIGDIDSSYNVHFREPRYNDVVAAYTKGRWHWSRGEFESFLTDRIVSRSRRDIEKLLFRCGLSSYDAIKIGIATKAVNASDLIWITDKPDEKMGEGISRVFDSVFLQKIDAEGDSVDTPDGYNIKRYGVYKGKYGIYKKRLSPLSCDAESELAVYELAKLMNVPCCRVYKVDEDTVFSTFEYDFASEYIVHMRRLFEGTDGHSAFVRGDNEYLNLISARPQFQADFVRMIALDFVTRQDDRHLSNIAFKIGAEGESFYPLYDNGRSLFYEDTEETAARACGDIELYATTFGPSGTYYDYVREISDSGIQFGKLLNLNIEEIEISKALTKAGFKGYRYDAALKWITETLKVLKELR